MILSNSRCTSEKRLDSKIAIVTGANTGIGYETALDLAKRGARVILACRDKIKADQAAERIIKESKNTNVQVEYLDLADLDTIRAFAQKMNSELDRLDLLVNNAGVAYTANTRTKQGFEMQFGVNHLGHFLLTNLLLDLIKRTEKSRIINFSSKAHKYYGMNWDDLNWEKSFNTFKAYCQSKTANILFTKELARRLEGTDTLVVSLHPGVVLTELTRNTGDSLFRYLPAIYNRLTPLLKLFMKNAQQGAQTTIHCCVSDDIEKHNGCYFNECQVEESTEETNNPENAKKLWDISCKMVQLNSS